MSAIPKKKLTEAEYLAIKFGDKLRASGRNLGCERVQLRLYATVCSLC